MHRRLEADPLLAPVLVGADALVQAEVLVRLVGAGEGLADDVGQRTPRALRVVLRGPLLLLLLFLLLLGALLAVLLLLAVVLLLLAAVVLLAVALVVLLAAVFLLAVLAVLAVVLVVLRADR
eukprot:4604059-Prymnesium_polylepis.1